MCHAFGSNQTSKHCLLSTITYLHIHDDRRKEKQKHYILHPLTIADSLQTQESIKTNMHVDLFHVPRYLTYTMLGVGMYSFTV